MSSMENAPASNPVGRTKSSTKIIGKVTSGSTGHSYCSPLDAARSASRAYSVVPLPQIASLCSTPGSTY